MRNNKVPKMLTNSLTGIIASVVSTVSLYLVRIFISRYLGEDIYGINSIFISIVSALLILELGMSTAMIVVMYQPVAEENHEKIKSILNFYKKFYRIFCLIILGAGLLVCLFLLKFFVNTALDFTYVRLSFLIYLFAIIFKYLWSYKCCILYANKKNNIISLVTIGVTIVFSAIEICFIVFFKNYWIYLVLYLLQNVFINVFCNLMANKYFPFIKEKEVVPLEKKDKDSLIKIVKPMFVQRLASQIQDASSVIVLGVVGTSAIIVGYYSNYILIVHACQTIFNQIGASFATSYGNYSAKTSDVDSQFNYYTTSRFCMSWVAIVFSILYLCLIQPVIRILFGASYCMPFILALVLTIYVFVVLNSSVNLSTQNAVGAHSLDTVEMIIQAFLGILLSVVFGLFWGPVGVSLGMLISISVFTLIIKGAKIVKSIYHKNCFAHFALLIKESLSFIVIAGVCYSLTLIFPENIGFFGIILLALSVFLLSNLMLVLINIKSKNLKTMVNVILRFIPHKIKQK